MSGNRGDTMNTELPKVAGLFDLSGKSALVTGATGSLGSMAAKALSAAGAAVTLSGGNLEKLEEMAGIIRNAGGKAHVINRRPDSEENVDAIVQTALDNEGGLDILFVASGFNKAGGVFDTALSDFDAVHDANVRQTWLICKKAGEVMIDQGRGGKIVVTSSVRGVVAADNGTAYCSSKAATDMLTKCFATEYGSKGITVNAIAPTVFRSPLTAWLYDEEGRGAEVRANVLKRIPLGRLGEPEDFVVAIIFCSSSASDFMTGHTMYVDGGFVID